MSNLLEAMWGDPREPGKELPCWPGTWLGGANVFVGYGFSSQHWRKPNAKNLNNNYDNYESGTKILNKIK